MKSRNILLDQTDQKIENLKKAGEFHIPAKGWINAIRLSLNMSFRQVGQKLGMTAQSANEMEKREADDSISLNGLKKFAEAMDMKFVYGFVPNDGSLEKVVEKRAYQIAKEIVGRTSVNMNLEDQKNTEERLKKAVQERANEIKREIPRYLWD
jgi:predicted DNA-binding mobile mystery protein A